MNHCADLPPVAKGDANRMRQVVLNLILFSIQSIYKSQLTIKTETFGSQLKIIIENSKTDQTKGNSKTQRFVLQKEFVKLITA